ncbi:TRAP transporter small permease [Billgrantia pellis]|uniref:TRAP transporter small permease protein n=1 Tax=Billgrantia pellis TaxID=2606936 RepID=A0A7V7KFY9_9GAMM|nr:TRAP transporter small permease [Halomonas pellis]KAA0011316.1 TRAP transporter small permease [Halomonas pellis]
MVPIGWLASLRDALSMVARGGLWLSILLLLGIAVLVAGQVMMRNAFSLGLHWADELARWFGIALVYLTIPHLLDRGAHITVELLPNRLKGRWRMAVLAISELAVASFAGLCLVAFHAFLERAARFRTPALDLPNLFFYMPAVVGIALLGFIAMVRVLTLLGRREPS